MLKGGPLSNYTATHLLAVVTIHRTPASSPWIQLWLPMPLLEQSINLVSEPIQPTLSNRIGERACPCPNPALDTASAPIGNCVTVNSL